MSKHKSSLLLLLFFCFSFYQLTAQQVYFSVPSGFSNLSGGQTGNAFTVELTSDWAGDIRYTLDGSTPTFSSKKYDNPILVEERNSAENTISNIPTNPATTFHKYLWKIPNGKVPKARILKAALFNNEVQLSNVFFEEYFIGEILEEIQLPIISIQSDSLGLFGYENGIYVPGKDYDDNPNVWQPGNYFNRGDEWERVSNLSFYENQNLAFRQKIMVDMHGGASRVMPCKSMLLSAKNSLGAEYFEYPFFEDRNWTKYKRVLLRNSGQDFHRSLFADVLLQTLLKNQNVDYQASRQVVVFLNGTYWGIHNLREKYDKYYFKNYHEGDLGAIDYVEIAMQYNAKEGSSQDFENMIDDLLLNNLSQTADYEKVAQQIDLENYINHHISKVYGGGNDWGGNNERLWRTHEPNSRWRWMANDYDDIFEDLEKDSYLHATRNDWEGWPNPQWATRLFRSLMTNGTFAQRYKNRLKFLLENTYHPENVVAAIDSISAIYRPEMARQIQRWNHPSSVEEWENNIDFFRNYAEQRPTLVWQNFLEFFPNIPDVYNNPSEAVLAPNPVIDFVNIDLPLDWSTDSSFEIFRIDGKKMLEGKLTNEGSNQISLQNFGSGFYVVVIFDGERKEVFKIVK